MQFYENVLCRNWISNELIWLLLLKRQFAIAFKTPPTATVCMSVLDFHQAILPTLGNFVVTRNFWPFIASGCRAIMLPQWPWSNHGRHHQREVFFYLEKLIIVIDTLQWYNAKGRLRSNSSQFKWKTVNLIHFAHPIWLVLQFVAPFAGIKITLKFSKTATNQCEQYFLRDHAIAQLAKNLFSSSV